MKDTYYKEHEVFIEGARKLLASKLSASIDTWEKAGNFPDEVFTILGEAGYLGILVPETYGGIDGDYKTAAAWCEIFGELPAVGLTTAVNMHSIVVCHAIAKSGSEEIKARWLPKAVSGEYIGAYAFTEPGVGSDLANCRTKAEKHGNKWIINGSKTFITNGARARFVLMLTRTDFAAGYKGFTTFIIDTKSPGFKVNKRLDKLGWRSSDTAEIFLENLEVDQDCVLGKVGDGWIQASNNLNWERLMLTLLSLGGARACLRNTLKYAQERTAFGKKLSEFDEISKRLQKMRQKIILGEALTRHALDLLSAGQDCRKEVSVAKRLVCDDAVWLADQAIQIHGGYGYTSYYSPERWWRDLRLMPIGGGTREVMANIVSKDMGWG